jgi:hypothetical protein
MKQENVDINIGSKLDAKGFKQAETALSKLNKSVKSAAGAIGIAYGARAITQFGIASAKAFAADDAAATKLAQSVKNLGLAYANDDIRKYIDSLTLATGVADSQLRPALQALLQVTGSVTKSQLMLSSAINISRGSGVDLATVANDLSQAYVGNLRGLRKYNLGLTKAELAASSFVDIQNRLNTLFAGASAAYLKTYAGQMELLTNSANEAKEVIGKSLVEAVAALGKDDSVANLATDMQHAAEYTADVVTGIGAIIDEVNNRVPQGGLLQKLFGSLPLPTRSLLKGVFGITDILAGAGQSSKAAKGTFNFASGGGLGTGSTKTITDAQAKKADDLARKRAKELAALTAKQIKLVKEQTALQKAGTLFDLEQTSIIAALKGQISDDERKRLELQLALLTGNTSEASKLAGQLAASQGLTKGLIDYLKNLPDAKNPFGAWAMYLDGIEAQVKKISMGATVTTTGSGAVINSNAAGMNVNDMTDYISANPGTSGSSAGTTVVVNVAGSVVSEGNLVDAVRNGLINSSLSGAGSLVARRTGTFATL